MNNVSSDKRDDTVAQHSGAAAVMPLPERFEDTFSFTSNWTDVTGQMQAAEAMRIIVDLVSGQTGEAYFRSIVLKLCKVLAVDYALVGEYELGRISTIKTLAVASDRQLQENLVYTIEHTPCGMVLQQRLCIFPNGVQAHFPKDPHLEVMGMQAYAGIRLDSATGAPLGLLAVLSRTPIADPDLVVSILKVLSVRVAAELERRRLEEQLRVTRDQALQSAQVKAAFLANMSHEIRTPLNGVVGMLDLLRNTSLNAVQMDYVETAHRSADALLSIINDILDFSKIEAGKLSLEVVDMDVRQVVEDVCGIFRSQADEKGLDLACFVPADLPAAVRGDPTRLRQVLMNLISNALKFTQAGQVVLRTTMESRSDEQIKFRFEVIDTGIGIPPAALNRLFHPFEQVDASTTRRFGGTGLGLSICKTICERMGGEIGAASEEGKGSTFWFSVVLDAREATEEPLLDQSVLNGQRVLVVDNNVTNLRILENYLAPLELQLTTASGGIEALDRMRERQLEGRPFSLVILDMKMPKMSGLDVAWIMQREPALARVKRILLSSIGGVDAEVLDGAGIGACLLKPVRREQLVDALMNTLRLSDLDAKALPKRVTGTPSFAGRQILLVEDNAVNRKVALAMLRKLKLKVAVAENGRHALETLAADDYELVLMDCQMPEMDGFDATREIRRTEAALGLRRLPIIAMTANAMEGDRERCLAAGMDDYLAKPIRQTVLTQTLARWLSDDGASDRRINGMPPARAAQPSAQAS